jgi:hypothetical protein
MLNKRGPDVVPDLSKKVRNVRGPANVPIGVRTFERPPRRGFSEEKLAARGQDGSAGGEKWKQQRDS